MNNKFIPKHIVEEIRQRASLAELVAEFHPNLKKSGRDFKGVCPNCSSNTFAWSPGKGIVKCFKGCAEGVSDAVGFLIHYRGMKFNEAIEWLANKYNITIDAEQEYQHPEALAPYTSSSFRDAQLQESGIPDEAQQYTVTANNQETKKNRYSAGTLDNNGNPIPGFDMLLHYLDLDGNEIMYRHPSAKKDRPYIRIRFASPEAHPPDANGKHNRYKTPYGGGNHLWIPEAIRNKFSEGQVIDTLVFIEGEKKADALCIAGIDAVGIAGINNFSKTNEMPQEVERLVRTCAIQSVVFFLDSDFDDLGKKVPVPPDPANSRPRSFYLAVNKFKKYFEGLSISGNVNVRTYVAFGIDKACKGMDDLLVYLRDKEKAETLPQLSGDLYKAMRSLHGTGDHIRAQEITQMYDFHLKELWHIQNFAAFKKFHKARLKEVPEFKFHNIHYKYNSDKDDFEIAQPLMPDEMFWRTEKGPRGKEELVFYYTGMKQFLANRGFAQIQLGPDNYLFVHIKNNVVKAIDTQYLIRFVDDFVEALDEPEVGEMFLKGGLAYTSKDRLARIPVETPEFIKPCRDKQIIPFEDCFWEVTKEDIKPYPYTRLPGAIWSDDIIPFKAPTVIKDFIKLIPPSGPDDCVRVDSEIEDSHLLQFLISTSDILWRTATDESLEAITKRHNILQASLADKIIASGYIVSNYFDSAEMKAIVPMDAMETKSGKSEGGTGKSLFAHLFKYIMPMVVISGKRPNLTQDKHIYENVTTRTRGVIIDDCRRNIDFESFFNDITYGLYSEPKGQARTFVGPKRMLFPTNHTIKGDDKSSLRRQYPIAFSDFFNPDRTPFDVFGKSMFEEWDRDEGEGRKQWNYTWNYFAHALQIYMCNGLKSYAPTEDIQKRKLRAEMGEPLLDFLETYLYQGSIYLNCRHDLSFVLKQFLERPGNGRHRMYADLAWIRDRIEMYCRYAGFRFNPSRDGKPDKRIRSGGKEYFLVADSDYSAMMHEKVGPKIGAESTDSTTDNNNENEKEEQPKEPF